MRPRKPARSTPCLAFCHSASNLDAGTHVAMASLLRSIEKNTHFLEAAFAITVVLPF